MVSKSATSPQLGVHMMIRRLVLSLSLACLLALPLLRPAAAEDITPTPYKEMAVSVNDFAREFYGRVSGGDGNLFFSPYSVHAAMLLTREGADGATLAEMDKVLGIDGFDAGQQYIGLSSAMLPPNVTDGHGRNRREVPAYTLDIANALWGHKGFAFEQPFLDKLEKTYAAPLARVDFTQTAAARKAINDWVAKATRDKIEDIVPEGLPPADTRMALANAIYFKAQWQDAFRKENTKDGDFTGPDGKASKAKLMHRKGSYRYAEVDGVKILEVPYRGGHLAMHVYLPKDHTGLKDVETKLREGKLDGERSTALVDVKLPRWKVTSSLDVTRVLAGMGMPLAFDPSKADFSKMTKEQRLFVGLVLHKAFVAVDENGTEAAAATVVMMRLGSAMRPQEPKVFHADRPFVYEIRHRKTGAVLFAGRVTKP